MTFIYIENLWDNHGIIGNASGPVTIFSGNNTDPWEAELLRRFRAMPIVEQARLLLSMSEGGNIE